MIVLGVLVLIYAVAGYLVFWRALNRMEPRAKLWINIAGAIITFVLGPAIFAAMFVRALLDPRYQPVQVVIVPMGAVVDGKYTVDWKGVAE